MKKYFNIKKTIKFITIFTLFFAISSNVKADNSGTYKCYYPVEFINQYLENGEKVYLETTVTINNNQKTDSVIFKYYASKANKTTDTYEIKNGKKKTTYKISSADLSGSFFPQHYSNGCPTIYMSSDPSGNTETLNFWTCTAANCGTPEKTITAEEIPSKTSIPKNNAASSFKSCPYSGPNSTDVFATLKYNFETGEIYVEDKANPGVKKTTDMTIDNLKSTYSTTCPNKIYSITPNYDSYYLVPPGDGNDGVVTFTIIGEENKSQLVPTSTTKKNMCDKLESSGLLKHIKNFYNLLRFMAPVIIIVYSIIDFVGVVLSGNDDSMEKAKKRFVQRLIIGVAILFIPAILEFLLRLAGITSSHEGLVEATCNLLS